MVGKDTFSTFVDDCINDGMTKVMVRNKDTFSTFVDDCINDGMTKVMVRNTAKVLSYEDIDELNQQVVERPVTIFQNLNAPAPCEEDIAEPTPLIWDWDFILGMCFLCVVLYVCIFFFWPAICATYIVNSICECRNGEVISEVIEQSIREQRIQVIAACFCLLNSPLTPWLVIYLIWYAPYSYIYFAVVFVATIICQCCMYVTGNL